MKWNWGTGIAATLLLFAGLMTFMVVKATEQRFDLVSENYYEEELAYQEIIDQKSNTLKLKSKARISIEEKGIMLNLPKDFEAKEKEFTVLMYFELDSRNDFTWDEKSTSANQFEIPFPQITEGKWTAKVKLKCEDIDYYFEPQITL